MADRAASMKVRELEDKISELQKQIHDIQAEAENPKPGPPKDGKIWVTRFPDHPALWLEDGRNVRLSDGKYGGCTDFIGSFHTSYTVPLADLRAVVEAHDPANGEAPPSYAELLGWWKKRPLNIETNCGRTDVYQSATITINNCPDWLDTTGATKDRSKFPPLEHGQLWRTRAGEVVQVAETEYGSFHSGPLTVAKQNRDYDGDEGPDHALVEYLGRVR